MNRYPLNARLAAPLVAWVDQPEVQPTLPSSLLRLLIQLFKARGLACVVTVSASSVPQVASIAETKPNPSQLPKQIGRLAQGPATATENGNFSPLRSDILLLFNSNPGLERLSVC